MRRRKFITLLAGIASWPLGGQAQDRKRTVGILVVGSRDPSAFLRTFQEGLRETGYGEVQLDIRSAEGKGERLPELAAQLVRDSRRRRFRQRSKLRQRSRSSWTRAIPWEWGSSPASLDR